MAGIGRTMNGKQQTEEGDEEIDLFRERIREAAGETFSWFIFKSSLSSLFFSYGCEISHIWDLEGPANLLTDVTCGQWRLACLQQNVHHLSFSSQGGQKQRQKFAKCKCSVYFQPDLKHVFFLVALYLAGNDLRLLLSFLVPMSTISCSVDTRFAPCCVRVKEWVDTRKFFPNQYFSWASWKLQTQNAWRHACVWIALDQSLQGRKCHQEFNHHHRKLMSNWGNPQLINLRSSQE